MTPLQLDKALKRLGLSKAELADALGVTTRAVEMWAAGSRGVPEPVRRILVIADRDLIERLRAA